MEKRILEYYRRMSALLSEQTQETYSKEEWERMRQEHLVQLSFFQHERLIHLIVTVTFAVLAVGTILFDVFCFSPGVTLLVILLLSLLIPYIRHYYILENTIQKMYGQYDQLSEKISKNNECIGLHKENYGLEN